MRNYVIINGVNSLTIQGLAINNLPPITKPMIRTQREEIDGRDGDIVTELGYSAYDKQIEIGLWGNYDINDIIKYFTGEGTIVFSNEEDKYYNFKILDQIDYEKLLKFKTATITLHCQPFKYPLEEAPVETEATTITGTGETITLNNTEEAPITIDLKGNTSQATTTGKNLLPNNGTTGTINGVTFKKNADGSVLVNGTATSNTMYYLLSSSENISISAGNYYISGCPSNGSAETYRLVIGVGDTLYGEYGTGRAITISAGILTSYIYITNGATVNNLLYKPMLTSGSTATEYEPYTNGASPNPDYPQDIHVVSGDNSINVCGKNLLGINSISGTMTTGVNYTFNNSEMVLNGTATGGGTLVGIGKIFQKANTTYTFTYFYDSGTCTDYGAGLFLSDTPTGTTNIGGGGGFRTSQGRNMTLNTSTSDRWLYLYLNMNNNSTYTNYKLKLQIEEGTATTFKPYQGNTYPVNLPIENLFEPTTKVDGTDIIMANGSVVLNDDEYTLTATGTDCYFGQVLSSGGSYIDNRGELINVEGMSEITFTITNTLFKNNFITAYNSSKVSLGYTQFNSNIGTYTIPSNAKYITIRFGLTAVAGNSYSTKVQIEKGSKANSYTPYGTTPIELCKIGTYQDIIKKSTGKNLAREEFESKYYLTGSGDNRTVAVAIYKISEIIEVQPNTTYTISGRFTDFADNVIRIAMFDNLPTTGSISTKYISSATSSYTFTTDTNTTYIMIWNSGGTSDTTIYHLQLEKGSATSYEPYGTGWYVKKEIGKFYSNSTTNWSYDNNHRYYRLIDNIVVPPNNDTVGQGFCNVRLVTANQTLQASTTPGLAIHPTSRLYISEVVYNNIPTTPIVLYYAYITPTYTEITDSTLISQLEALSKAKSYDEQTNIIQVSNGLPFKLNVSVTFAIPMEINNIGNIYAKPILTIEGTGNIGVVLNDIQILEIDLTNNGKIEIDVTKLEAYNPDNNTLLNRLVTGDYMKLLINEGENTIKLTGNVSSATLTNYTRWI